MAGAPIQVYEQNITNPTWTITGAGITSGYISGLNYLPLFPSVLNKSSITFFDHLAETITVTCSGTYTSGSSTAYPVQASITIMVVKPHLDFPGISNDSSLYPNTVPTLQGFFVPVPWALAAGETWSGWTINWEGFGTQSVLTAQIIQTSPDKASRVAASGLPSNYTVIDPATNQPINGTLDTVFPYDYNDTKPFIDYPVLILPNLTDGGGNDWNSLVADENFATYLIYKPTGGIYVPLAVNQWDWSGTDNFTGQFTANAPFIDGWNPSGNSDGGNPVTTDTMPTWADIVSAPRTWEPASN